MSSEKSAPEESKEMPDIEKESPVEEATSAELPSAQPEIASLTDPVTERPRRRFGLWLLLLAAGITAAIFFAPQQIKDEYLTPLNSWLETTGNHILTTEPVSAPEADTSIKTASPEQPVTTTEIRLDAAPISPAPAEANIETPVIVESKPSVSKEEIVHMLNAMSALQGELQSLRQQQSSIKEAQHADQIMQLRTRLRWITNQANHLPQIGLAWEEVSLMPVLSSDQREKAQKMQTLAEERLQTLQTWQQKLRTEAAGLTREEHANIIPAFETEWLNWIAGQFSIRRSLSKEEMQDRQLREQMLNISRGLEVEQWPDAKVWLQMRATLQLRKVAAADDKGESTDAVDLGLPESFNTIKNDITQLRQEAATWLEHLQ